MACTFHGPWSIVLQLQQMILSSFGGAGGSVIVTGIILSF